MRTEIALLVRLSMPPAVQQRIASDRASWAALTAGTHKPEPDPAQAKGDSLVIDRDADGLYGDGVEHATNLRTDGHGDQLGCVSVLHGSYSRSVRVRLSQGTDADSEAAVVVSSDREAERQAFLRRVQYVARERERRA